jgi:DNA polymerase III gamma/tau subunit
MPHSYLYITNNLDTAINRARHTIACMGMPITVGDFVIATNERFDSDNAEKPALTVDAVRGIIGEAYIVPTGDVKAILMPDADLMLHQAQSALLKVLEEPPEGVVFFLVAQDEKMLLPTIKSRVETIYLQETEQELNQELYGEIEKLTKNLDKTVDKYRAMSTIAELKDEKKEILDILEKIFSLQNTSEGDIVKRAKMQEKISVARQQIKSNCNWNGVVWAIFS